MLPMYVAEGTEYYRPEAIVWAEPPGDRIVGLAMAKAYGPAPSVSEALLEAMERPYHGPPRRPARVRIADREAAEELRSLLGDAVQVAVAPTPELHAILATMARELGEKPRERSYLDGDVSRHAVAALFESALEYHRLKPWKLLADDAPLRLDIPDRNVRGRCVSVIGALGKSRGFLVFPSVEGFKAFLGASGRRRAAGEPFDLGTSVLSLVFERAAKLPPRMRREAMTHAWPVAGLNAYPVVEHHDPDGVLRPLTAYDVYLVAACATVLSAFIHRHRESLARGLPVRGSEWYIADDSEAWLTSPPDAKPGFAREKHGPRLALRQILEEPRPHKRV